MLSEYINHPLTSTKAPGVVWDVTHSWWWYDDSLYRAWWPWIYSLGSIKPKLFVVNQKRGRERGAWVIILSGYCGHLSCHNSNKSPVNIWHLMLFAVSVSPHWAQWPFPLVSGRHGPCGIHHAGYLCAHIVWCLGPPDTFQRSQRRVGYYQCPFITALMIQ